MHLKEIEELVCLGDIQKKLSTEEMKTIVQILDEYAKKGSSNILNDIYESDYDEIPVDIFTFITNKRYLGNIFTDDNGNLLIYKFWVDVLKQIFSNNSEIFEVALSGAIGLGKSTIACLGIAYILYKLLCLKNPTSYYKLAKGSKMAIALFNINLEQSYGVGYCKLQNMLQHSPWFLENGRLGGTKNITYYPNKNIEIVIGSKMEHFLGRDIFAGFLDEIEFAPGSNPKIELSKIMKLYTTIKRRMESRYMKLGRLPGILFLVSSKKSNADFLEQYLKRNKEKPYLFIVDEPIWTVKACQSLYSGKTFKVAVGNNYLKSKIIKKESEIKGYKNNGQEIIDIPVEYKEAFELDINTSLMDIAGKALASNLKYIYYDKLKMCYREYLKNPFTHNEILLGFDDESRIEDFFLEDYLSKEDRNKPYFIHWDTSKTGDGTGLAMTTIVSTKEVKKLKDGEIFHDEDIIHKLVFAIKIKAQPGSEIPFYKIRNFIYYLRDNMYFNIISTTCDSYQSVDTLQQFSLKGFLAETLSVDKTRMPYDAFKNAINEGRYIMPYIEELELEILNLEDDKIAGKIDHPIDGSKDMADACAASLFKSINYKKLLELHNKSEDSHIIVDVNKNTEVNRNKNWILDSNRIVIE